MKMGFGYILLLVLAALAAIIGLGHVEAKDSFGLDIILGGLLTLAGAFSGWAFKERMDHGEINGGKAERTPEQ